MCPKGIASRQGDGKHCPSLMIRLILSYSRGDWPKWFLVGVWAPVLSLVVAWLFAVSAAHFPGGYDWRYDVMCRLGYSWVNPDGSVYWSLALCLVCVMGLPCCGYFRLRLEHVSPRLSAFASRSLLAGLAAGFLVGLDGVFLPRLDGLMPKLHEVTATFAFAAIFFGVMGFWFAMMKWLRSVPHWSIGACVLLSLLVAVPFTGAMVSQAYLFFVPNNLGWVGPGWAELGVPIYLSFAFWEWLAIAGIYLCLYLMAFLLPPTPHRLAAHGSGAS